MRRIRQICDTLSSNAQMGERRKDFASGDLRSFSVGKYIIFFRPARDGIEVARVVSGYRDWRTIVENSQ
jgi:toxin ParE1/3/4